MTTHDCIDAVGYSMAKRCEFNGVEAIAIVGYYRQIPMGVGGGVPMAWKVLRRGQGPHPLGTFDVGCRQRTHSFRGFAKGPDIERWKAQVNAPGRLGESS